MLLSKSDNNTSFTTTLYLNVQDETYNSGELGWKQFLQDHREYIIARSTLVEVTPNEMTYYKHRIRKYLAYKNYSSNFDQIFRLINRLPRDQMFNETVTSVYLPDSDTIAELRRSYQTLRAQILRM